MDQYGVAIDALASKRRSPAATRPGVAPKAKRNVPAAKRSRPLKGSKLDLSPKYENPETGETWTGRGRPPARISRAKDRSRFLISKYACGLDVTR
ncbi:H-NS family nucleoid-associated regulatory protein [Burkholderia multivorans]|uniref:H-NS family nucleoid-associated regulatory protein n=1 Tax=Burkholderia multivorans TaxID=87883 RepID=UPI00158EF4D0